MLYLNSTLAKHLVVTTVCSAMFTCLKMRVPAGVANTGEPDGPAGTGDATSRGVLANGEDNLTQDFGYDANSVLGDRVWWDLNRNGVQEPGEPGINGVEITATGPNGLVLTTTTGGDGDYLFVDIPDRDWTITVGSGVPAGFDQTFDFSGSQTDGESTTTLATEGAAYATAPVHYAMDIDRVSVMPGSGDAVGQGVPTVSGDPHVSRNNLFAAGVFHGVVAFDGPALITQSHTLSTLTTAV